MPGSRTAALIDFAVNGHGTQLVASKAHYVRVGLPITRQQIAKGGGK